MYLSKKYTYPILFLLIACIFHTNPGYSQDSDYQAEKDSLLYAISTQEGSEKLKIYRDLIVVMYRSESQIDTIMKYLNLSIEEAKIQGNLQAEASSKSNILVILENRRMYDQVFANADNILVFLSDNNFWDYYYYAQSLVIKAYNRVDQKEKAFEEAEKIYQQAKEQGEKIYISRSLEIMASLCYENMRQDAAELYYRECLEIEKQQETISTTRKAAYVQLIGMLTEKKEFNEAEKLLKEYEADIITIEKSENYAKDHTARSNLYLAYQTFYYEKEDPDKVWEYCDLIEKEVTIGRKTNLAFYRMWVLIQRKDYEKALEWADISYNECAESGLDDGVIVMLREKAYLFTLLGKPEEAKKMITELLERVQDTYNAESVAQLDELRTIYEVDKLEAQKAHQRMIILFGGIGCILLLFIIVGYIIYSRRLKQKNLALYHQIQDLSRAEKETERIFELVSEAELSREMKLFKELSQRMHSEKLFLDPVLDRRQLASDLGTNEKYLANAVREGVGTTLAKYISDLRLTYSLQLLGENPDMTLETVAEQSGHGSYSAFFTAFVRKYGMGPSDYRKFSSRSTKKYS